MSSQLKILGVLVVVAVLFTAGCGGGGPSLGEVSGKVTLDGQPLAGALVEFQPAEGRGSIGVTDAQGSYRLSHTEDLQGAVVGTHTVRITMADEDEDPKPRGGPIPARYNRLSELTAEVQAGSNECNFELQSK
jgi:hypothetical protein